MSPPLRRGLLLLILIAAFGPATAAARAATIEVVVTMEEPSLAKAVSESRVLSAAAKQRRFQPYRVDGVVTEFIKLHICRFRLE